MYLNCLYTYNAVVILLSYLNGYAYVFKVCPALFVFLAFEFKFINFLFVKSVNVKRYGLFHHARIYRGDKENRFFLL